MQYSSVLTVWLSWRSVFSQLAPQSSKIKSFIEKVSNRNDSYFSHWQGTSWLPARPWRYTTSSQGVSVVGGESVQCWSSLNIPAAVLSRFSGCGQWFSVRYSQGCAVVCPERGFLATVEGAFARHGPPHARRAEKTQVLPPQVSAPSQDPFDAIRCDVGGFPQLIFCLKKWFRAGCTCWCLLIPEVTLPMFDVPQSWKEWFLTLWSCEKNPIVLHLAVHADGFCSLIVLANIFFFSGQCRDEGRSVRLLQ